jgi:hypothetical protein
VRSFTISRRVKSVQDQKTKRRRAVIVGFSSDNGQSRTVLDGPQGVDCCPMREHQRRGAPSVVVGPGSAIKGHSSVPVLGP